MLAGAQSRYGPAAPLVHVHRLLADGARFAVVAKPCDISAVRALQRRDPRARAQIAALLTSYCGGVPSLRMAERIVRSHGVDPGEVELFQYRGDGWPGPLRTRTRDGREFDVDYDTAWYDPGVPWEYDMQFRCKICPDAVGEVADVSCPDGWVLEDGQPDPRRGGRPQHHHRPHRQRPRAASSARGPRATSRRPPAPWPSSTRPSADHHPRKLSAHARAAGVRLAGRPSLRIRGYRGLAAVRRAGPAHTLSAAWGGFRRARRGATAEPLP